jgi:hypothetical protein
MTDQQKFKAALDRYAMAYAAWREDIVITRVVQYARAEVMEMFDDAIRERDDARKRIAELEAIGVEDAP